MQLVVSKFTLKFFVHVCMLQFLMLVEFHNLYITSTSSNVVRISTLYQPPKLSVWANSGNYLESLEAQKLRSQVWYIHNNNIKKDPPNYYYYSESRRLEPVDCRRTEIGRYKQDRPVVAVFVALGQSRGYCFARYILFVACVWNTRGFACVCVCVCVCVYVCPLELYVYQSEAMLVMVKQIVIRWTC